MKKLNFSKLNGLVPAIVQNADTLQVLMLGFMNQAAYQKTLRTKKVWFYSRTKGRLWQKGEESGNTLKVVEILLDCDSDTLLIKAKPLGPTCHTGEKSCFGEAPSDALSGLYQTILERQKTTPQNSYTASLFRAGLNKICAKVKEESDEAVQAAKEETRKRLIEESADLLYHLFVLLVQKRVRLGDVEQEFLRRRG